MLSEIDPQVKALLEQFQAQAVQNPDAGKELSLMEVVTRRRQSMEVTKSLGLPFESVAKTKDFDISGPGGNISVRLYVPLQEAKSSASLPILVYYHGGAFVAGSLDSHDTLLRGLANRGKCLILSVAYRLAPENPYPAPNDDAWTALVWTISYASQIGADPHRVAVGGDSAGGLLAAFVSQKAREEGIGIRLQVLLYPNLDTTTSSASWKTLGNGDYIISHSDMVDMFDAYIPKGVDRLRPEVSPFFAEDLVGLAPALIVTADHDPLSDEGDAYATKLKQANVKVIHIRWTGMIHGFASLAGVLDAGKAIIDRTAEELRQAFV